MSRKRKKITVKDLRKHIVSTRKVKGGKIHTINTPNAGPIEIVEGNQHSKGGVNYIKTSDGVTHEIENNEVVLPTDKGPYVVSDYMNTDGTKSYNKNKTSYADLVKHLAMAGASKQDLERVAMQTEIANGNNPNNPTSLIKDTNVMKQPKVNLEYQQTKALDMMSNVSHGLHAAEGGAHLLKRTLPRFLSKAAWPLAVADGLYQTVKWGGRSMDNVANQQIKDLEQQRILDAQTSANNQQLINNITQGGTMIPEGNTSFYQQTQDRQSRSGKDNFWGNLFGPKRTEVQIGGDDVRLEDEGSVIDNQILEYNILDGDTTSVNQYLYTNQYGDRVLPDGTTITTTDELKYNIGDGSLIITDKSGKVHKNVTQVSNPNQPSIFEKDLEGNFTTFSKHNIGDVNTTDQRGNVVRTNTSTTPSWDYGNVHITDNNGQFNLVAQGDVTAEESVNTFRNWMHLSYPDFTYKGEGLNREGPMNDFVRKALKMYGKEFIESMQVSDKVETVTTEENMSTAEINKLLKKKYQQPYQYKGGGRLTRKYQETDDNTDTSNDNTEETVVVDDGTREHDGTEYVTTWTGDETNVPTDYLFNYDANLVPITEDVDNTYDDYDVTAWSHEDGDINVYPSKEEFWAKGFRNVQEWRDWVKTQPGFEDYDFGNLAYWGPKHQAAWKGMRTPVEEKKEKKDVPCTGPNCNQSTFTSNEKKIKEDGGDGKKINWKKWGGIGLAGLAAFGAYKAISGQMGKTDDMLEAAKNEKPNMIGKQQLGRVDLQRISHRSQMVDAIQRGQSMDNSVAAMHIPEAAKYLLKERNTITTQGELNKIKEAENNVNVGISVKEGGLNAQMAMKQAELNTKVDVANQLEQRDIREQKYAAWDRQVAGRQQLISDLIKLGGQGIEAYATLRSKSQALTNDPNKKST